MKDNSKIAPRKSNFPIISLLFDKHAEHADPFRKYA